MNMIAFNNEFGKKNFTAYCIECGEEYSYQRRNLGYKTCLDCGEDKKIFPTAPAFNKGAYTIVTANNVKDIGK